MSKFVDKNCEKSPNLVTLRNSLCRIDVPVKRESDNFLTEASLIGVMAAAGGPEVHLLRFRVDLDRQDSAIFGITKSVKNVFKPFLVRQPQPSVFVKSIWNYSVKTSLSKGWF